MNGKSIRAGCLLATAMLVASLLSVAAEQGQMTRDAEVRKEPRSDAEKTGDIAENTPVQITQHQGAWVSILAAPTAGWVRMLSVRPVSGTRESSDGSTRAMLNLARTGSSGAAVATGVRGLDREGLSNASPNNAELQKLDAFQRDLDAGNAFGQSQPALSSLELDYLGANGKPEKPRGKK